MSLQLYDQISALVKSHFLPKPVPQIPPENTRIKVREVGYDEDGASNGGGSTITLCLDGQAHLTVNHSWHDRGRFDQHSYSAKVGPCTCHDFREISIPEEHAQLMQKFLRTGQIQVQKDEHEYEYDAKPHLKPEYYWDKICLNAKS